MVSKTPKADSKSASLLDFRRNESSRVEDLSGAGRAGFRRSAVWLDPDASLEHIRRIFYDRAADMCCEPTEKGCLLVHTAMELAPQDAELQGVLQKFMRRMSKTFAVGLANAKARGEVRADLDERVAADLLTSTMFGLAVLGRVGFSQAALEHIVDATLESFRAPA